MTSQLTDLVEHISLAPGDESGEVAIDLYRDATGAAESVAIEVHTYGDQDDGRGDDAQLILSLDEARELHLRLTALLLRAGGSLSGD
jgi:hypothetical protein